MKPVLVISSRDNVATALTRLEAGQPIDVDGRRLTPRQSIPSGHKVAIADIAAGHEVIKYGSPIGIATASIQEGDHVHTHNVASTRGRGDLHAAGSSGSPGARGETRGVNEGP
jgi:altronate dehydratase